MPRKLVAAFVVATVAVGAVLSWFASTRPDGLEWSIAGVSGREELPASSTGAHRFASDIQERVALMPDYALPQADKAVAEGGGTEGEAAWPAVDPATSLAGLVGAGLTLVIAGLISLAVRRRTAARR
jgi:cobalt/nickel transport system permease protein